MTTEPVDVVRRIYDALARGERAAVRWDIFGEPAEAFPAVDASPA